jgi:thiol-disulfide isomerase/thioredoxin
MVRARVDSRRDLGHSAANMLPVSLTIALFLAGPAHDAAPPTAPAPTKADAAAVHAAIEKPGASAVLVNVWATWCAPCREEFPDLLHVAREFRGKGLRTVLVSADFEDEQDGARKFLSEHGVDFDTYIKTGKDEEFVNGLSADWSGALPATFVYDGRGRLVRFWEGKASYPILKKRVQEALARKETP